MKKLVVQLSAAALLVGAMSVQAQISIVSQTAFSGDGWLSPAENTFLDINASPLARGLAYNPVTKNLLFVSRVTTPQVHIITQSGTSAGTLNLGSGIISGGSFTMNMVGVGGDGAVYVGNLASPLNPSAFKVYRWASQTALAPTVAFSSTTISAGRLGDTFDVVGSGTSTLLVAGEANTAGSGNRNGYAVMNTADGINFSGNLVTFPVSPAPGGTAAGDFRLGLTFAAPNQIIGSQGGSVVRGTSYSGATGTLLGSSTPTTTSQRIMDYTVLGGLSLLAAVDTVDGKVRIYDASNPGALTFLVGQATAPAQNANSQGVGSVAWGEAYYDSGTSQWKQDLYTLNAANGIQAFIVAVPEPGTFAFAALGLGAFVAVRRFRK